MTTPQKPTNFWVVETEGRNWFVREFGGKPESFGATLGITALCAAISAAIGIVLWVVLDAVFLGGVGLDRDKQASDAQAFWIVASTVGLGMMFGLIVAQIAPRMSHPIYFPTRYHQEVYKEYIDIEPELRYLATDAYDAVVACEPLEGSDLSDTFNFPYEVRMMWSDTLREINMITEDELKARQAEVIEPHLAAARENLELLRQHHRQLSQ